MKRSGFTMIELVFVIVILGILASVAIPKLAATRDDAQIAKATSEISSLISDFGSYYTAQGGFPSDGNFSDVTNVKLFTSYTDKDTNTKADAITYSATSMAMGYYDTKRAKECLAITVNDTNGTVNLAAGAGKDTSVFCKGLYTALNGNGMIKKYTFGGSSIYK